MKNHLGFTLIEISLVLTIIALLAGAVVISREVIKDANIMSLVNERNMYISAIESFNTVYDCLPGDCSKARNFFSATDANGNTINNGNGDGAIGTTAMDTGSENLGFWQHLAASKLISGSYKGNLTSGQSYLGDHFPRVNYDPDIGFMVYNGTFSNNYTAANALVVTSPVSYLAKIRVLDAAQIDNKIDDGMPYTGKVISYNDSASNCVSSTINGAIPSHALTYMATSQTLCKMVFAIGSYVYQ
jgi:prepilin-type N-terminal cleavage/methylation domain-containing protein